MQKIERQELYCHNCRKYVQFDVDLSLNGNHVIECPSCKHEHCRKIKDGIITEDRWDSRNTDNSFYLNATNITYTVTSTYDYYSSTDSTIGYTYMSNSTISSTTADTDIFLYGSWMNTTSVK